MAATRFIGPPVNIWANLDPVTFKPLHRFEGDDPEPSTPAPPRGGESGEDYNRRCGPFVEIGGRHYQKRWVEWRVRQQKRLDEAAARAPKAVYTLHPSRMYLADRLMLALAIVGAFAALYLAVYGH